MGFKNPKLISNTHLKAQYNLVTNVSKLHQTTSTLPTTNRKCVSDTSS
uniref:Uncharacterized protein n=1 Tax=Anguilla anguilla TaxID=7936 RepID=A0A0E9R987_ANGAN